MKIKQSFRYAESDNTISIVAYLTLWQRIKLLFIGHGKFKLCYRPLTYFGLTGRIERLTIDMASGRYTRSLERALEEIRRLGGNFELFLELRPKQKVGYLYLKEQLH